MGSDYIVQGSGFSGVLYKCYILKKVPQNCFNKPHTPSTAAMVFGHYFSIPWAYEGKGCNLISIMFFRNLICILYAY